MKVASLTAFVTKALETIDQRIASTASDIKTLQTDYRQQVTTLKTEQRELVRFQKHLRKLAPTQPKPHGNSKAARAATAMLASHGITPATTKGNGKVTSKAHASGNGHAGNGKLERGDIQRRVLLTIERLKTPSTEEIAKRIHHPSRNTYQALHRLLSTGQVKRIKPAHPSDPMKWSRA